MKNQLHKTQNKKLNTPLTLIFTALGLQVVFFTVSCILALIFDINSFSYYIFAVAALALGSGASGFITARKIREKGMLYGALFALPSNLIFVLISSALNEFSVDYNILLTFALLVVCSAAGGVISVNIRPKKKPQPKHLKR